MGQLDPWCQARGLIAPTEILACVQDGLTNVLDDTLDGIDLNPLDLDQPRTPARDRLVASAIFI